jgi:signal peptidase I
LEVLFLEEINLDTEPQQKPTEEHSTWGRYLLDLLETIILSVVLFLGINAVSARVRVDGSSMIPTLEDGEYVLVNRLPYKFGLPGNGDIIVFRFPGNPKEDYIKRVIGLPGDKVIIADGSVVLNGTVLDEPYIAASPDYSGEWNVPDDYLFVLGDNRNNSSDSHDWGLVPMENVIGKALVVYWPPPKWVFLTHDLEAVAAR